MKILKSQKGSILLETAIVCIILVIILMSCMEIFSIITNTLSVNKIVRESTRAASIASMQIEHQGRSKTKLENIAEDKGKKITQTYLPGKPVYIHCDIHGEAITCQAMLSYQYLEFVRKDGIGGRTIYATATYPCKN